MTIIRFIILFSFCLTSTFSLAVEASGSVSNFVKISKIDGKGNIRIRRMKGTEIIASEGDNLSVGDKIITDGDSTADLLLQDGSLVRVGLNTDYKIQSITEEKPGLWSWAFEMLTGSIRALIEKSQEKGFVKFKVNTPSGTMGVRGTEIILTEKNNELELAVLKGEALLGPAKASFDNLNLFQVIRAGTRSTIIRGEKKAKEPITFTFKDLLKKNIKLEEEKNSKEISAVDPEMQALFGIKKKLNLDSIPDYNSKEMLDNAIAEFNQQKEALAKNKGIEGTSSGSDKNSGVENTFNNSKTNSKNETTFTSASNRQETTSSTDKLQDSSTAKQSAANNVKSNSFESSTAASDAEKLKELNKLVEDSKTALQNAPQPVFKPIQSSTSQNSKGTGGTGSTASGGGGTCYSVQYYYKEECRRSGLFGLRRRCENVCMEGQTVATSCPKGYAPGAKLKDPRSPCGSNPAPTVVQEPQSSDYPYIDNSSGGP